MKKTAQEAWVKFAKEKKDPGKAVMLGTAGAGAATLGGMTAKDIIKNRVAIGAAKKVDAPRDKAIALARRMRQQAVRNVEIPRQVKEVAELFGRDRKPPLPGTNLDAPRKFRAEEQFRQGRMVTKAVPVKGGVRSGTVRWQHLPSPGGTSSGVVNFQSGKIMDTKGAKELMRKALAMPKGNAPKKLGLGQAALKNLKGVRLPMLAMGTLGGAALANALRKD